MIRRTNALGSALSEEAKDLAELRKAVDDQGVRLDQLWELSLNFESSLANIDSKLEALVEATTKRAAEPENMPVIPERPERDPEVVSTGF